MKISKFATDLDLEEKGTWVDIGEGGQILVARIGNPAYREKMRHLSKPYQSQIRQGTLPEDLNDEIFLKAIVETILLDWKGIEDDNGKEIKYSKDAAMKLLLGLRDFRDLVIEIARSQATFRREEIEETGKS